ncbi:hypothetical protein [Parasphingorhabdus sp.]|uniref:hypothetical protein n=1 Tax=Parasphingorhabdus sp. TaxID=2709688 RepID=UPI003264E1ED
MPRTSLFLISFIIALAAEFPAFSQERQPVDPLQYADLADLAVQAPVIARITVNKAIKVDPERSIGAPTGTRRFYIIGATNALIRGRGGIADTIRYIIDIPMDARGRTPKLKKREMIVFGRRVPGRPGEIQLVAGDAQIAWTPARASRIRDIVKEVVAQDSPPPIKRIGNAFHVPGTIIGEGETQIFLESESGQPVSITILSRAGQKKRWAVSLSEIVDEAARAPIRNSLLWYRLACFLPRDLPEEALNGTNPTDSNRARLDYRMVIQDLGNCPRSRRPINSN